MKLLKNLSFITAGFLIYLVSGYSQQNQTLYFMDLPQSRTMNPSFQNECRAFIGLPVINSTYVGLTNNSIGFNDLVFNGTGAYADSLITFLHPSYNVDDFLAKLKPVNNLTPEVRFNIFNLGFWSGDSYISFDISDNIVSHFSFPDDLLILALKGNTSFINDKVDLTNLAFDAQYYREFGLGFSKQFSDKLTIGVKGKVYLGMANVSLKNNALNIAIDQNDLYSHTIQADISLNSSFPLTVTHDSSGSISGIEPQEPDLATFFLNTGNPGVGIDIGAQYDVNDYFSVSASVIDLGFIRWTKDVTNLTSKGNFKFEGLDISSEFNVYDNRVLEDVASALGDSLLDTFNPVDTYNPYTTYLPVKIYLGAAVHLTNHIKLGLLSKTTIQNGKFWESATASANFTVGRFITTSFNYSIINSTYNNIGFGLGFRAGPFQWYVLTDQIVYEFSRYDFGSGNSLPLPADLRSLNLRFGLNLMFGCKPQNPHDLPLIH